VRGNYVRFTPKGDGGCVGGSKQNGIKPLRVRALSTTSKKLAMSPPRKARMIPSGKAPAGVPGLPSFADTHVLRGILDAMPARVSYFDAGRNYRYNNKEFYDFMGLKPDQVLGRNVAEVLGQQASDKTLPQVEAVRRGETTRIEGWRDYKGQGWRYVETIFMPLFEPSGEMDGYFTLVRDMTDHQRQKEELLRRSQQLEGVMRGIDDAMVLFDADLRLVLCNQGYLDLMDFPPRFARPGIGHDALIRNRLERGIFYSDERPDRPIEDLVRAQSAAYARIKRETQHIHRIRGRWFNIRRRRLPDGSLLITFTDITGKYEADRAKRAQREALQRVVQMETNATLLAGLGHEINNPLAAILAQASGLMQKITDPGLTRHLECICEAAERAGRIVHSLMRSARRREQRHEPMDISATIRLALELAWNDGPPPWLDFQLEEKPDLPKFIGDSDQIAHVIANLVSNATQALEAANSQTPKRLSISVGMQENQMIIRVADNGPGIPAEIRDRIFEPFFTTKPPEKGTGVGLALCRALAQSHDGSLELEETPGGGASFMLRLPLQ
jgi:two-component system NtrC family sensor kinase